MTQARSASLAFSLIVMAQLEVAPASASSPESERFVVESGPWRLVGELRIPHSTEPVPIVLLLNQAAGDRRAYAGLAGELAARGFASLRLDLRGHGESTNLGRFEPGRMARDPLIWDAEADVLAALESIRQLAAVDTSRIGILGASYSAEEAIEAGRMSQLLPSYVLLSPGSLSRESLLALEQGAVPWLLVTAKEDPFLEAVDAAVVEIAPGAERLAVPGSAHGTELLNDPELSVRIAEWVVRHLDGNRPEAP